VPAHWHLLCSKQVKGRAFAVECIVRDGYQEAERQLMFDMGYEVALSGCNDDLHLGPEPPSRGLT
jgi:hypothetical protein